VVFLSPGTERLIGDALTIEDGRLSSWAPNAAAALHTAISRSLSTDQVLERITNRIALPRRNCRWPVFAQVIPMVGAAHDVFMLARSAIVITDPEQRLKDDHSETLGATYRLSRAESRFALRLAQGDSLKEIAEAEGIALETARSRLKAIFTKTGTHCQAELVLLMARLTQ
jgi:DNA-binding CsgD family transcriptional regulator